MRMGTRCWASLHAQRAHPGIEYKIKEFADLFDSHRFGRPRCRMRSSVGKSMLRGNKNWSAVLELLGLPMENERIAILNWDISKQFVISWLINIIQYLKMSIAVVRRRKFHESTFQKSCLTTYVVKGNKEEAGRKLCLLIDWLGVEKVAHEPIISTPLPQDLAFEGIWGGYHKENTSRLIRKDSIASRATASDCYTPTSPFGQKRYLDFEEATRDFTHFNEQSL